MAVGLRGRFPIPCHQDLVQIKGREGWYEARWAAVDQPEWNQATFLRSRQLTPKMRLIVLEIEISREKVALRNAYKHVGQRASVRVNGLEHEVTGAVPRVPVVACHASLTQVDPRCCVDCQEGVMCLSHIGCSALLIVQCCTP